MANFPGIAGGLPVFFFNEIGSTNAEALARAGRGEPEQWIAAARQTAGRGRRGRAWVSEPGNLYASLLLYDPAPAAVSSQICFVAALALHDALYDLASDLAPERLRLKWPNDVLLDGKKIAGILVEGIASGERQAVVTGFGVNCAHHPADTPYPTGDLQENGIAVTPERLLAGLADRLMRRLAEWQRGNGFVSIRKAWLARAFGVGGEIEVRLSERVIKGRFEEIDETGALILEHASGEREVVRAGDVFPLVPVQ